MRKALFWLHLLAGCTAGLVILLMSVTGVLLTYEQQIIRWVERGYRSSASAAKPVPVETLLARVQQTTGSLPSAITIKADKQSPAEAAMSVGGRILFTDASSGEVLGESSQRVRGFFRGVTDWHRWLAMKGESRPTGRAITGASNLLFLGLVLTGIVLWFPRRLRWTNVRAVLFFRGGLTGKARDFNWHNVIGVWCGIPLVFIVLGALVISYPWATNLVYAVTGTEAPKAGGGAARTAAGTASAKPLTYEGLNLAMARAQREVAGWQVINARLPEVDAAHVVFTVDLVDRRGRPDKRTLLTVDRATGEVVRSETFASYNAGRKARTWLRWIHTGEAGGIPGQTIAGIASAGAAVLVWTGLALAWRRFRAWKGRNSRKFESPVTQRHEQISEPTMR